MITVTSWVDLAIYVCPSDKLYIQNQSISFWDNNVEVHTSFSPQETAYFSEPSITDYWVCYIAAERLN